MFRQMLLSSSVLLICILCDVIRDADGGYYFKDNNDDEYAHDENDDNYQAIDSKGTRFCSYSHFSRLLKID